MRRLWVLCTALLSAALISGCSSPAAPLPSSSGSSAAASSQTILTPEDGVALLEQELGVQDPDTGNPMSYGYEGTLAMDGVDYYNYRVSWLVDGNHLSYLTNYLVSTDGTVLREYMPENVSSASAEVESAGRALLESMAAGDFTAVAQWAGVNGVTFTPYSAVDFNTDRTVSGEQLAAFGTDETVYTWGSYDGSGEPMALTCQEYWDLFVWNTDYTAAPDVSINQVVQQGNSPENVSAAYGCDPDSGCMFVEYHFDGLDSQYGGADWCALKLVFQKQSGAWKLIGVIHSEMTM